ncbi:MAG: hypothetical protein IJ870_06775 [Alphaproteobacteria bacterium]|nr:hypothetical protein [Alphaproteobacteria bacterium]
MNTFYKYIVFSALVLMPVSGFAEANCDDLPSCTSIGFIYSSSECGSLSKLKCPFGNYYFCSKSACTQVSLNTTTEYCTAYCSDTPSMCISKSYKSCSTTCSNGLFCSSNSVGKLHEAGSTISSSSSNYITGKHYLYGDITQTSPTYFQNAQIYSARKSYPLNCSSGTMYPKLKANSVYLSGSNNTFEVNVDFGNIEYDSQYNAWNASFNGKENKLNITFRASTLTSNFIPLNFGGGSEATSKVCISVESNGAVSQMNPLTLSIYTNGTVKYYAKSSYFSVNCIGNGSCVSDGTVCNYF